MEKKHATNMEVKKNNRNSVFRYIRERGTVSNPDIAYDRKISLPTVTQITKELIEKGLVEEVGELRSTGGRRAKALSVSANVKQAAGVDITKNHIGLVLTNLKGEVLKYERIYQPFEPEDAYYRRVNEKLECFLDESGAQQERMLGVGVSFPGIVNRDRQMISYSHILGVESVRFDYVSQFFPYSCIFLNDANAGAYAEAYAEGTRLEGIERFFYLSLSNTVGGAIFSGSGLVQGTNFRCGEVGHMTIVPDGERCYCGKRGCLDAYCGAGHLSEAADGGLGDFFALLEAGHEKAVGIWNVYTDYLAVAINNIHMVLDCDVVLGGYVGSYVEPYMQEIRDKVYQRNTFEENSSFVKACHYKVGAAALGAACNVIEDFVEQI